MKKHIFQGPNNKLEEPGLEQKTLTMRISARVQYNPWLHKLRNCFTIAKVLFVNQLYFLETPSIMFHERKSIINGKTISNSPQTPAH